MEDSTIPQLPQLFESDSDISSDDDNADIEISTTDVKCIDKKLRHKWIIPEFKNLQFITNELLYSNKFYFKDDTNVCFRLFLYVNNEERVCFGIDKPKYKQNENAKCLYKGDIYLPINDSHSNRLSLHRFENLTYENNFETLSLIKSNCDTNNKNTLTICCEIEKTIINLADDIENVEENRIESISNSMSQISIDYKTDFTNQLYTMKLYTDVVLACANKKIAKSHKCVLAAASPLFKQLFDTIMDTNVSGLPASKGVLLKCNIKFTTILPTELAPPIVTCLSNGDYKIDMLNFDLEIVEEMLLWIYTGTVKNLKQNAGKLLSLAEKFNLDLLKSICEQSLIKSIDVNSVASLLMLADRYKNDKLKKVASNFVCARSQDVIKDPSWQELILVNPHLVAELWCFRNN